jgi:hypothetical protein
MKHVTKYTKIRQCIDSCNLLPGARRGLNFHVLLARRVAEVVVRYTARAGTGLHSFTFRDVIKSRGWTYALVRKEKDWGVYETFQTEMPLLYSRWGVSKQTLRAIAEYKNIGLCVWSFH